MKMLLVIGVHLLFKTILILFIKVVQTNCNFIQQLKHVFFNHDYKYFINLIYILPQNPSYVAINIPNYDWKTSNTIIEHKTAQETFFHNKIIICPMIRLFIATKYKNKKDMIRMRNELKAEVARNNDILLLNV